MWQAVAAAACMLWPVQQGHRRGCWPHANAKWLVKLLIPYHSMDILISNIPHIQHRHRSRGLTCPTIPLIISMCVTLSSGASGSRRVARKAFIEWPCSTAPAPRSSKACVQGAARWVDSGQVAAGGCRRCPAVQIGHATLNKMELSVAVVCMAR